MSEWDVLKYMRISVRFVLRAMNYHLSNIMTETTTVPRLEQIHVHVLYMKFCNNKTKFGWDVFLKSESHNHIIFAEYKYFLFGINHTIWTSNTGPFFCLVYHSQPCYIAWKRLRITKSDRFRCLDMFSVKLNPAPYKRIVNYPFTFLWQMQKKHGQLRNIALKTTCSLRMMFDF